MYLTVAPTLDEVDQLGRIWKLSQQSFPNEAQTWFRDGDKTLPWLKGALCLGQLAGLDFVDLTALETLTYMDHGHVQLFWAVKREICSVSNEKVF